jgi:Fur family transcriptional regulator, zinc uptake regulator
MQQEKRVRTIRLASELAQHAGTRLTRKREAVFSILLDEGGPISAYDLIERYRETCGDSLSAMSAYRMLNVLVELGLVHKLETTNQFIACQHITCSHSHNTQFLICDTCDTVAEINVAPSILRNLARAAEGAGFRLPTPQLELHGICSACQ